MTPLYNLSRWQAAGIHLGISAAIAVGAAALVFGLWYPDEFLSVTGGLLLFRLLVFVDVTLGPLMTLIVFNAAKKSLKFDLIVIAAAQLLALAYGLYTVSEARPVYLVFVIDRFEVVTAAEVPLEEQDRAKDSRYRSLPWFGPRYVAAEKPPTQAERDRVLFASIHGVDLHQFPEYYVPYDAQAKRAAERAIALGRLVKGSADRQRMLEAFLAKVKLSQDSVAYLPLHARFADAAMLVHKQTGEILGVLPINPWQG